MTEVRPVPQFNVIRESTREGLTLRPLTPRSLTPRPLTPQPLTLGPLTLRPLNPRPVTPRYLTLRPCRELSPAENDITDQSNEDPVQDARFCGESFADNSELLSSLSPLLFNMKLFGLHFHRQDRRRRHTGDPEWNQSAVASTGTSSTGLRVHATVMLIVIWVNAVRFVSVFTRTDRFGAILFMKITVFTFSGLIAILQTTYYYASHTTSGTPYLFPYPLLFPQLLPLSLCCPLYLLSPSLTSCPIIYLLPYPLPLVLPLKLLPCPLPLPLPFTTYYYASHTGQLFKILSTLPVTRHCVRETRRAAIGLTTFIWLIMIVDLVLGSYVNYNTNELNSCILAPFVTHIYIPQERLKAAAMVGYVAYMLIFPGDIRTTYYSSPKPLPPPKPHTSSPTPYLLPNPLTSSPTPYLFPYPLLPSLPLSTYYYASHKYASQSHYPSPPPQTLTYSPIGYLLSKPLPHPQTLISSPNFYLLPNPSPLLQSLFSSPNLYLPQSLSPSQTFTSLKPLPPLLSQPC